MPRSIAIASKRQAGGGEIARVDGELVETSQQSLRAIHDDVAMVDIDSNEAIGSQGEGAGKRKRDASQSFKTTGTSTLEVNNSDSEHEAAVLRRSRRPSQKVREASDAQSLYEQQDRQGVTQAVTNNDIMALLLQIKSESIRKDEENKKKEEKYQKEIENLRAMVISLTFNIKSLQNASPNWGPVVDSESVESPLSNPSRSYAEVVATGISRQEISSSSRRLKGSRVSFNPNTSSSDSSPRRSPP